MTTIDFNTFQDRVSLLQPIDSTLDLTASKVRFQEEDRKLVGDNEQILLIVANESPHPKIGTKLFRSLIPYQGFDKTILSCYDPPPSPNLNRCNIPRYPVFYCSDRSGICIRETLYNKPKQDAIISYLSVWNVNRTLKWKILPFIFTELPDSNLATNFARNNYQQAVQKYTPYLSLEDIDHYIEFYNNEFRRIGEYKFSSIISHQFLNVENGDIIFYPSVQLSEGNNYAFNINHITDKNLSIEKIFEIEFSYFNNDWMYTVKGEGTPNGTIVDWSAT